jgi:hypothetical protein
VGQAGLAIDLGVPLVELAQGELKERQAFGALGVGQQALVERTFLKNILEYEPGCGRGRAHDLGQLGRAGWSEVEAGAGLLHRLEHRLLEHEFIKVSA